MAGAFEKKSRFGIPVFDIPVDRYEKPGFLDWLLKKPPVDPDEGWGARHQRRAREGEPRYDRAPRSSNRTVRSWDSRRQRGARALQKLAPPQLQTRNARGLLS